MGEGETDKPPLSFRPKIVKITAFDLWEIGLLVYTAVYC